MRKILLLIVFFFLSPCFTSLRAETIKSFTSNIKIQEDGTIEVQEIIVYDFEGESRHGIFRDLSTVKTNTEGKRFRLKYTPKDVIDESGKQYQWKKEQIGDSMRLKIGDPDETVTGTKIYQISYSVNGALTYFSDHDELYWNITGNDWNVPILGAHTRVILPQSVESESLGMICYTGVQGSTSVNCSTAVQNGLGESSTQQSLSSGEGMTASFSFPTNLIAVLEPEEIHSIFENPLFVLLLFVIGFIWYIALPVYLGYRWLKQGRDPKPVIGQASVWFDPPKTKKLRKLTPGETGTLLDEEADLSDLAATIVDLARRGFLTIIEDNKQYTLSKTQSLPKDTLESFEKTLFDGIFKKSDSTTLKNAELQDAAIKAKNELYDAVVTEGFFDKNPEKIRTAFTGLGVLGLMTGNLLLFISCMIFGRNMPKKTLYGSDQAAIGKALKSFLSSQEKFLTFQAEKMAMFEKLLPYAVAFGVEKLWAKRFADLEMQQPKWYVGTDSTIRSVAFVNHLSGSMNTFRSAATPTSSSSGFSSGSSGGFSGGGGGGGGGGSW